MAANTATRTTLPARFTPHFIEEADQRVGTIRLVRSMYEELVTDTGADTLAKRLLAKRAIFLAVYVETMEVNALNGEPFDGRIHAQMTNALNGVLTKLGLERKMKTAGVTDLTSYLQGRAS